MTLTIDPMTERMIEESIEILHTGEFPGWPSTSEALTLALATRNAEVLKRMNYTIAEAHRRIDDRQRAAVTHMRGWGRLDQIE